MPWLAALAVYTDAPKASGSHGRPRRNRQAQEIMAIYCFGVGPSQQSFATQRPCGENPWTL